MPWSVQSHDHFPFTTVRPAARIFSTGSALHGTSGSASTGPGVLFRGPPPGTDRCHPRCSLRTNCRVTVPRTVIRRLQGGGRARHTLAEPASARPLGQSRRAAQTSASPLGLSRVVVSFEHGWPSGRRARRWDRVGQGPERLNTPATRRGKKETFAKHGWCVRFVRASRRHFETDRP